MLLWVPAKRRLYHSPHAAKTSYSTSWCSLTAACDNKLSPAIFESLHSPSSRHIAGHLQPSDHMRKTGTGPEIPEMSLLGLPSDLLIPIFNFLPLRGAKALSVTHSALRRPARYRILRGISIDLTANDFTATELLLEQLSVHSISGAVRTLTVKVSTPGYAITSGGHFA